jgi:predicted membrane channel-forming protein YqfA (hemolysin III family)
MLVVSLVLAVAGVLVFWFIPTFQVYATYPWPSYVLLASSVLIAFRSPSRWWRKGMVVAVTSTLLVLFVGITAYLPRLYRPPLAVKVGDRFPDFTLTTSTRESFSPSDLRGKTAALYVFYRGDW